MNNTEHKIKIGIVDSGISRDFLHAEKFPLAGGAFFKVDWESKQLHSEVYSPEDLSAWLSGAHALGIDDAGGHGTAIASILHRNISIPAEFYVVKALDENLSGSSICILAAISWLFDEVGVDYINLSLGSNNFALKDKMQALVQHASEGGCKLYAAAGDIPTLPSELSSVTAVGIASQVISEAVKVDCVIADDSVMVCREGLWLEQDMTTSYACPLALAQSVNASIS